MKASKSGFNGIRRGVPTNTSFPEPASETAVLVKKELQTQIKTHVKTKQQKKKKKQTNQTHTKYVRSTRRSNKLSTLPP